MARLIFRSRAPPDRLGRAGAAHGRGWHDRGRRARSRPRRRRPPLRRRHSGPAEPAQPRLPARHGRPRRGPRAGPRHVLDLARGDVPLPRPPRRPTTSRRSPPSSTSRCWRRASPRVGEFHYLHHDVDGRPYAEPAEMAGRIAAAAAETGIGLTLLPCYYAQGGFGGAPPTPGQRRFVTDPDSFARLVEGCRRATAAVGMPRSASRRTRSARSRPMSSARVRRRCARRPDPHPRRRAGAGGGGLPRLVRPAPGRVAAGRDAASTSAGASSTPRTWPRRDRGARALGRGRGSVPDHRGEPRRRHLPGRRLPRRRRPLRRRQRFERPARPRRRAAAARVRPAARRIAPATSWPPTRAPRPDAACSRRRQAAAPRRSADGSAPSRRDGGPTSWSSIPSIRPWSGRRPTLGSTPGCSPAAPGRCARSGSTADASWIMDAT